MTQERTPVNNGGGLQITLGVGAPQSKLDKIADTFATQTAIEEELVKMGVTDQPKPNFELPVITRENLTTTNSKEYTDLYAKQLAWFNYLTPIFASVEVALLEAKNTFDLTEAAIKDGLYEENKLLSKAEKLTSDELKNKVLVHPSYQEALLQVQRMTQYKMRLKAMLEIADRNMTVISRQVEIRRQEIEGGVHENNMPRRGRRFQPITR